MADQVLDVITRLTYEAQTGGLEKSIGLIEKEIAAIDKDMAAIQRLEQLRQKTDASDLQRINQINQAIENRNRNIQANTQTIQRNIQSNESLRNSLARLGLQYTQTGDRLDRVSRSSNTASQALINLGRVAQDAPYGFIGIANNINPLLESFQRLRVETGSNIAALKSLGASLIGGAGIGLAVSVVTSLLVTFGQTLFNSGEEAKDTTGDIEKLTSSLDKLIDAQTELNRLNEDATGLRGAAARKRALALEKAQKDDSLAADKKYYEDQQNARQEDIKELEKDLQRRQQLQRFYEARQKLPNNLESFQRNDRNLRSLLPSGITFDQAEADFQKSLKDGLDITEAIQRQILAKQKQIDDLKSEGQVAEAEFTKDYNKKQQKITEDNYKDAIEALESEAELKELNDEILKIAQSHLQSEIEIFKLRQQTRAEQGIHISGAQQKSEQEQLQAEVKRLENIIALRKANLAVLLELNKAEVAGQFGKTREQNQFTAKAQQLDLDISKLNIKSDDVVIEPISTSGSHISKPTIDGLKRDKKEIESLITPDKDHTKKQLKVIEDAYKSTAQIIVGILKDVNDRQIALLDQQASVQEQRVDQATEIAKRGNIEILRQEQQRLDEINKKREESARKQVQLNALVSASNSALALTEAIKGILSAGSTTAAEGGGIVGYIAAIVAGLAAVAGLYSSIRSVSSNGFHDGDYVPTRGGYTGPSGEWKPAGIVHGGEFVFSKKSTDQLGVPFLRALHEGKINPFTANAPGRDYAAADMRKELREVKEAVENIHIKAHNSMDGGGVTQLIETTQRIERNKWV